MTTTRKKTAPRKRTEADRIRNRKVSVARRAQHLSITDGDVTITTLPVADIRTGRYQRPLDEHWVAHIAEHFSASLFEPLHVALRSDNNYYVVDGQHRLEAARRRSMETVPVLLHLDATEADEAAQFVLLQERRARLLQQDRFHARVVAGDDQAVRIRDVLAAHGFAVTRGRSRQHNAFMATSALEEADKRGVLGDVLSIMRDAWEGDAESLNASFVRGLAFFLAKYGHTIRREELVTRLRVLAVRDILIRAQIIAKSLRAPTAVGVAQAILDLYNTKRSTFRLEGSFIGA